MRLILLFVLFVTRSLAAAEDTRVEFLKAIAARDETKVRAMLANDPALVNSKTKDGRSAVLVALFHNDKGFLPRQQNTMLPIIAAAHPRLDVFDAAALGDAATLRALLKRDPGAARSVHPFGWTALHIASFAGQLDAMRALLDAGADIQSRGKSRFRNAPLHTAMLTGQLEAVKLLLDRGADPLMRQAKGFTPLHEAALLGRLDCARLLLDHGAEINSRADDGRTPLSEALRGGHRELAEFLRAQGGVVEVTANLMESPD